MAFVKHTAIPNSDTKIVPHDDPQVKKVKEQLVAGKKPKKSVTK